MFDLALHCVESSLRIIQLHLPVLCTLVVFTEGLRRVLQSGPQGFYFLLLRLDLLIEHFIFCRKGLHGLFVLIESGGGEVHFRLQYFELVIDFCQRRLKFFLAFDADFQTEI